VYSGDEAAAAYAKHLSLHGEARCAKGRCSQRTFCTVLARRLLRLRQEGRSARPPRARGPAGTGARARRSRGCCRGLWQALRSTPWVAAQKRRGARANALLARAGGSSSGSCVSTGWCPAARTCWRSTCAARALTRACPRCSRCPHARVCSAWSALEPLEVAPAAAQGASHSLVLQGALVLRLRS